MLTVVVCCSVCVLCRLLALVENVVVCCFVLLVVRCLCLFVGCCLLLAVCC